LSCICLNSLKIHYFYLKIVPFASFARLASFIRAQAFRGGVLTPHTKYLKKCDFYYKKRTLFISY